MASAQRKIEHTEENFNSEVRNPVAIRERNFKQEIRGTLWYSKEYSFNIEEEKRCTVVAMWQNVLNQKLANK